MSNILILPEDNRDLLMVSAQDIRDIEGMIIINQASSDWLIGKLDTGTYFDILLQYGIDPGFLINPVEELAFNHILSDKLLT